MLSFKNEEPLKKWIDRVSPWCAAKENEALRKSTTRTYRSLTRDFAQWLDEREVEYPTCRELQQYLAKFTSYQTVKTKGGILERFVNDTAFTNIRFKMPVGLSRTNYKVAMPSDAVSRLERILVSRIMGRKQYKD